MMNSCENRDPVSRSASSLTREDYLKLCKEAEFLELEIAKGQDTAEIDRRLAEITKLTDESCWIFDPDNGVVEKANVKPFNDYSYIPLFPSSFG